MATISEMENNQKTNFASYFKSPIITVQLGPNKLEYHLHRDILASVSPFLSTLIPDGTGSDHPLHLDSEVDIEEAFDIFVEYSYKGTYTTGITSDNYDALIHLHSSVYVLAERLVVPQLMEMALSSMVTTLGDAKADRISTGCIVEVIYAVYAHTQGKQGRQSEGEPLPYCSHLTPVRKLGSGARLGSPLPVKWGDFQNETYIRGQRGFDTATPNSTPERRRRESMAMISPPRTPIAGIPPVTAANSITTGRQTLIKLEPMRNLLANHCAEHIKALRGNEQFKELLRTVGEFAEDLVMCVSERRAETNVGTLDIGGDFHILLLKGALLVVLMGLALGLVMWWSKVYVV